MPNLKTQMLPPHALTNGQTDIPLSYKPTYKPTNCSLFLVDDELASEISGLLMNQYVCDEDETGPPRDPSWFESMSELVLLDFFSIKQRTGDLDQAVDFTNRVLTCTTIKFDSWDFQFYSWDFDSWDLGSAMF